MAILIGFIFNENERITLPKGNKITMKSIQHDVPILEGKKIHTNPYGFGGRGENVKSHPF